MRVKDKVAVVTGGASGIGEASVRDLIAHGARVVIADRDEAKGQALAAQISRDGGQTVFLKVDVALEDSVKELFDASRSRLGAVNVLVNNAGIGHMGAAPDYTLEDWSRVVAVNLTGSFLCAKYAIPQMKEAGGGSIVNVASILGVFGQSLTAAYSASKGGMVNLTRTLALEYAADNIRVNTVSPAYIDTPMLAQVPQQMLDQLIALHPVRRLGLPSEVAKAITFLASDDASFITGANLLVDGGFTAGKS